MRTRVVLTAICCALLASACSTPEQQAYYAAQEETQRQARYQAFISALKDRCAQYGFREGTESFARCMQNESRAAEVRAREDQARKDKDNRDFQCSLGNEKFCDNRPQRTSCTRDFMGNVQCVTR